MRPNFVRKSGVADFITVEIHYLQAFAMFPFAFTEIMKVRMPLVVLLEVLGGVLRHKNVTGVPAIHDALGDIDAGAGNVCLLVQIGDFVDRTTVNTHANLDFGMAL